MKRDRAVANKYTIKTRNMDGWWCAICPELCVSGFGTSESEAMNAVHRAMRTTIAARRTAEKRSSGALRHIASAAYAH